MQLLSFDFLECIKILCDMLFELSLLFKLVCAFKDLIWECDYWLVSSFQMKWSYLENLVSFFFFFDVLHFSFFLMQI